MSDELTKQAYEQLIQQDLEWLEHETTGCLERSHIMAVLRASSNLLYPTRIVGELRPCEHGRTDYRHCPHCLELRAPDGGATVAEITATKGPAMEPRKTRAIEVETCDDCPMVYRDIGEVSCSHPDTSGSGDISSTFGGPVPHWCPLRAKAATISLKEIE